MSRKKSVLLLAALVIALLTAVPAFAAVRGNGHVTDSGTRVMEARALGMENMMDGLLPSVADRLQSVLTQDGSLETLFARLENMAKANLGKASVLQNVEQEAQAVQEEVHARAVSLFEDVAVPVVENSLNMREEGTEEAPVIGHLHRGSAARIVEHGEVWSLVSSGEVTGYVMNDFFVTAEEAEALFEEQAPYIAVVTADKLRLREKADTDSKILSEVAEGDTFAVEELTEKWVKVRYTARITGWLSLEYAEVREGYAEAVPAAVESERKAKYDKMEKERERAAYLARIGADKYTVRGGYSLSESDIILIAATCDAEAGDGDKCYQNQLAVANVILNRLQLGRWGKTVHSVIYARKQFSVAASGRLQRILDRGPSASSIRAARAAASGVNNIGHYIYFVADFAAKPSKYHTYRFIGDNCFYD
ncbi:MAG: cell wall hydrolase [Lachnospiraceae bacterium]|nr:cell wall hydrolase [Lachnospiraceae bacterium]